MANSFYTPGDLGTYTMGKNQLQPVSLNLSHPAGSHSYVEYYDGFGTFYKMEEGKGLTVSSDRLTVSFNLDSSVFTDRRYGNTVYIGCCFFYLNRREYIMTIEFNN